MCLLPCQRCCDPAGPLPQVAGFPGLGVLRALRPVPARSTGHASTRTGAPLAAASAGRAGTVPTFIREPFDGIGTQLCPCTIATTTPQTFTVASRPATSPSPEVPRRPKPAGARCNPTHIRQVQGRWFRLEGLSAAGSSRMPLRLASRARPIWQYWNDSSLSRTAPPATPTPRQPTVLQLQTPAATGIPRWPFTTAGFANASWRSMSVSHSRSTLLGGEGALDQVVVDRRAGLAGQPPLLRVHRPEPLLGSQPADPVAAGLTPRPEVRRP